MNPVRLPRRALVLAGVLALAVAPSATATPPAPPAAATSDAPSDNLTPGPAHRYLDPLVGTWKATKTNWLLGEGGKPVVSHDMTVKVRWIKKTGGRFLSEETRGTLAGRPYFRLGVLGHSNIDERYEWTTFDSVTPTTMTYRGTRRSATASEISMPGQFTDPGVLGPDYLGKTIPMRTVITIRSGDHHTIDLYFTPPGQQERLVDRVVYERRSTRP
ncbi:DUF1579 family protein [Streptomyces flavidovirens]|uniref:DUF1579 family protein n=1 Tax=Streptomyces flavidovirens TaxID=67298 RepID=UPI00068854B3|nr:DUF1579 family protein [Streptomyces flavidovirens]